MKRSRLSRSGSKARPKRMKALPKFERYDQLNDFLSRFGLGKILDDIYEQEKKDSRGFDYLRKPEKVRERILVWWNTEMGEADITSQRSGYVLMFNLKEQFKKRYPHALVR